MATYILENPLMNQTVTDIIKNAMNSGDIMKFTPVLVTPDVATAILEHNYYNNRRLSKSNVDAFCDLLKSGAWMEGSPIRFAREGDEYVLVDGQHRLRAIIDMNISVRCVAIVDKNAPSQAYSIADAAGRIRTISDGVHANGIGKGWSSILLNSFGSAVKIIHSDFLVYKSLKNKTKTKIDVVNDAAKLWHPTMESVVETLVALPKTITSTRSWMKAPILAVVLATWKYQEDKAYQFWVDAILDNGLMANQPEKFMHELMTNGMGGGSSSVQDNINKAARIWNYYWSEKQLVKMPIGSMPFPGLLGTPYAK